MSAGHLLPLCIYGSRSCPVCDAPPCPIDDLDPTACDLCGGPCTVGEPVGGEL